MTYEIVTIDHYNDVLETAFQYGRAGLMCRSMLYYDCIEF